ncbi:family 16 glycoside hydrolase [Paludisphaera mucosa]|uniref:DUF1080 domain-containing protein n=1 Tax=Paludisphaera mucosa TaxID=3030827 RepID=A0ABT6FKH2_9BACT|nr:family 16 glycoside hydrolase [Paludisphaera mucosa]MDG3007858.1 DUF1080 domain-containing protein [Paludisphaera mucosa]
MGDRIGTGLRRRAAAGLAAVAALAASAAPERWDFERDAVGAAARGIRAEVGRWEVAEAGGSHVLAQRAESPKPTFNVALVDGTSYRDVDLSVRVRADAGAIDQGGGIVWRAKDRDNYYVARYNPMEDNLRVYKVESGRRTQLDHADAPGDKNWHTLRIVMTGREITGWLDGVKLLVAEDSTFPDAGRIGLWSKSDARSSFDDLTATVVATP